MKNAPTILSWESITELFCEWLQEYEHNRVQHDWTTTGTSNITQRIKTNQLDIWIGSRL